MPKSWNILIGGEAGQGLVTIGQLLSKSLVRSGYHISVSQDYMSRVRGGHNTYSIRVSTEPVAATMDDVHIMVAMTGKTIELHGDRLVDDGFVVLDTKLGLSGDKHLEIPFADLAPKPIFINVAALGVLCRQLGLDVAVPRNLLAETFKKKGEEIVALNAEVLEKGYNWVDENNAPCMELPAPVKGDSARLMMNGNEAIAMGALAAGLNFACFYPMTPATSVIQNIITRAERMGVVVEQVEDEIGVVNMALGASYAGARSLVATSGGGFALMEEGISLAAVTELPLLTVVAQRPGPATGLPTRTEQCDLNLVVHSGHGEFPRAIYAPGTVEDCFHLTHLALDQAEVWQVPTFVLTDQFLADSYRSVEPFDLSALPEPAGPTLSVEDASSYKRYAYTENNVSPRLVPGTTPACVVADSHEHTEDGHITEDVDVRVAMQDKRMNKISGMKMDVVPPTMTGEDDPELLLVCWGSTCGAVEDVVEHLNEAGTRAAMLHFTQVYPLRAEDFESLQQAKRVVCVEGNATAQFAGLVRRETGIHMDETILRYDGRPFTANYILDRLS